MFDTFPLWPARASTTAGSVDALFIFLVILSAMMSVAIFTMIVVFAVRYRRRAGVAAEQIEGSTALEITWSVIPLCIFIVIFVWGAVIYFKERTPPRGADRSLCRRQAVDVEAAARRRPARDQRTARARGPRRQDDHDLAGCDPQLLCSRLPHQAGCSARPLHHGLVSCHQGRNVSSVLRRVLRHAALRHDRPGRGDGAGAVPGLAERRRRIGIAGVERAEYFSATGLLHLPPLGHPGPRAQPGRAVRQAGAAGRRTHRYRRRKLHSRIDPESRRENRERIQAHHAGVSGTGERRTTECAGGIREVTEPEPSGSGGRSRRSCRRTRNRRNQRCNSNGNRSDHRANAKTISTRNTASSPGC